MRRLLFVIVAIALGVGTGEYLSTSFLFRRSLGHFVRRGDLQALVGRRGLYDTDVERARQAGFFANGGDAQDVDASTAERQKAAALARLMGQEKLRTLARAQTVESPTITREMDLLRAQFRDEKTWGNTLTNAGLSRRALEDEVTANLRERQWLEGRIAAGRLPNESAIRAYFAAADSAFAEPLRLRASHLFLAAPDGSPTELIEAQRALAKQISRRLANGESFPALVTEFSEDEATRLRDGDLNFFAEKRMLPEVFDAARALRPGETSPPIRSRLGFHIVRLTDLRPPLVLSFEEAQPEIAATLSNERRATAVPAAIRR